MLTDMLPNTLPDEIAQDRARQRIKLDALAPEVPSVWIARPLSRPRRQAVSLDLGLGQGDALNGRPITPLLIAPVVNLPPDMFRNQAASWIVVAELINENFFPGVRSIL